jgi:hypothetical protein
MHQKYMTKWALFVVVVFSLISCEEENHGIIFDEPAPVLKDTTYITSNVPAQPNKKVLLEDLTGVRCVNCPQAAAKAHELSLKYKDELVVMGVYLTAQPQFTAPWQGFERLSTAVAQEIANAIGNPQGLPSGYVDRYKFGGSTAAFGVNLWDGYIQQRLGTSPVKIELDYANGTDNKRVFKTKLTYVAPVAQQHKLALYIIENDIISKQSTIPGDSIWNGVDYQKVTSGYIDDYSHQHVLRTAVTQPLGELLTAPLERGRVFEKDLEFEWPAAWKQNKSYLIAVVINAQDESVVQVEKIKLY